MNLEDDYGSETFRHLSHPIRVLFVCTGNINRSAAAEILARRYHGWEVDSAGLRKGGHLMSPRMRERLGVTNHRSDQMSEELAQWADVIIGFQPSHLVALAKYGKPVRSLAEWVGVTRIPDPNYDSSGRTHDHALMLIRLALPRLYEELVEGRSWLG